MSPGASQAAVCLEQLKVASVSQHQTNWFQIVTAALRVVGVLASAADRKGLTNAERQALEAAKADVDPEARREFSIPFELLFPPGEK